MLKGEGDHHGGAGSLAVAFTGGGDQGGEGGADEGPGGVAEEHAGDDLVHGLGHVDAVPVDVAGGLGAGGGDLRRAAGGEDRSGESVFSVFRMSIPVAWKIGARALNAHIV